MTTITRFTLQHAAGGDYCNGSLGFDSSCAGPGASPRVRSLVPVDHAERRCHQRRWCWEEQAPTDERRSHVGCKYAIAWLRSLPNFQTPDFACW